MVVGLVFGAFVFFRRWSSGITSRGKFRGGKKIVDSTQRGFHFGII